MLLSNLLIPLTDPERQLLFEAFRPTLEAAYSGFGRPPLDAVFMLKVELLARPYRYSGREVFVAVRFNIAYRLFLEISLKSPLPHHTLDGAGYRGPVLRDLTDPAGLNLEVFVPPTERIPLTVFGLEDFALSAQGQTLTCPAGQTTTHWERNEREKKQCGGYPLREQCLAKPTTRSRTVSKKDTGVVVNLKRMVRLLFGPVAGAAKKLHTGLQGTVRAEVVPVS